MILPLLILLASAHAFVTHNRPTVLRTSLFSGADFAYQELRAQVEAIQEKKLTPTQINPRQQQELRGYCQEIINNRASLVKPADIGKVLPGTTWVLALSPEQEGLPPQATIRLDFLDDTRANYALEFTNILGLSKITAESTYSQDAAGTVTIVYGKITTDVLGLKNVNIGAFGLLQNRATVISCKYFDGRFWIDDTLNLYVRI